MNGERQITLYVHERVVNGQRQPCPIVIMNIRISGDIEARVSREIVSK